MILVDHHHSERLAERGISDPAGTFRKSLLHEMARAAVDLDRPLRKGSDGHGRRFVQKLRGLVAAGETNLRDQVQFYSMDQLTRMLNIEIEKLRFDRRLKDQEVVESDE
jgi:hypothetical protein